MLMQQTLDQLQALNLSEMARVWQQQQQDPTAAELSFDERFAQLVDAQHLGQHNKRLSRLLVEAKLRLPTACVEDLHSAKGRELDKPLIRQLSTGRFIEDKRGVLVVGATGTGKTYVSCALAQQACRLGFRTRYYRTSRLLDELQLARLDGSYGKLLGRLVR
jgi:DNA replication protein DnaC